MANTLSDVEGNILECKKAIESFDNELLNLNYQIFERIQTEFGNLSSELSNLAGLFDEFNDIKVSDGKGTWTKEAIATLGLYAQQYEIAKYQIEQYADAIDKLKQDYAAGRVSATEYMDKLADLKKSQYDAVDSVHAMENAIISLNKTRVDEEIETIEDEIATHKKLTDEMLKNLDAQEALWQHKKKLSEMNKTVADLERQLAAMQNDDSQSTIAKRKKLESELVKSKQDLADYEYEHSIDSQKDALNKQHENFEESRNKEIEALKATLKDRESLISQSFETVKANANIVGQEIAAIATEHGITISNAIITSWEKGENAIASYGDVLSAGSSAFIGNLMGVEDKVYDLQTQANSTADTLSYMFATRADTLVEELTASYQSEENLNNMTQILQNSLINTLERGYNISSITSAFDSIVSGANEAASAANKAADAISNMNSAGSSGGGYSGGSGGNTGSYNNDYSGDYNSGPGAASNKLLPGLPSDGGGMEGTYRIVRSSTGNVVKYGLSKNQADSLLKKYGPRYEIQAYAKGGIVKKDPDSPLNEVAEAVGEDVMVAAKEGERVLTRVDSARLQELLKIADHLVEHPMHMSNQERLERLANTQREQNTIELIRNDRPNVSVHYDSLITVNGDVNDTNHFLRQIEGVSQKVVNKTLDKIDREFKYR